MKIRLNNIRHEFDREYTLTKFAFFPVICEAGENQKNYDSEKVKYIVWFSDYIEFYDIKTKKLLSKRIY